MKTILLGATASVILTGAAFAQDATTPAPDANAPTHHHHHMAAASTGSDRLELLERRLEQQQQEIQDLKAQVANGQGEVSPAQFEALQNQVYETQATVKAAATPHDKKMHFKGITFTLGGFLAMESVWRSNNLESDIGSPGFSSIPFPGPGNPAANSTDIYHTREFRFTARQSRISGLAEGDAGDVHLSGYGEFDFLGAAASANSRESNSYTPRVRNLYGTADWTDMGFKFLFGQSWSLATLDAKGISERSELAPPTIEAQYVDGFVWTRQPQLRVVKSIGDDLWLGLSIENSQNNSPGGTAPTGLTIVTVNGNSFSTAGQNATADAEFNPGIQLSLNQVPDVIGKVAWEPDFFGAGNVHLEAMGMFRQFYDRVGITGLQNSYANYSVSGGGGGIAGLIKLWPGFLDLQFDTLFGSGIGRYGSGQLPDITFKANGTLQPLNENMEMIGLTAHATPDFDIYVFGGRESEDKSFFTSPNSGGYGNPAFSTAGCQSYNLTSANGKCGANVQSTEQINVGLWDKLYNGDYGSLRFGLQYSYTRNKAFTGTFAPGVFTAPHTDDNMIFTSFRYYPF